MCVHMIKWKSWEDFRGIWIGKMTNVQCGGLGDRLGWCNHHKKKCC